VELVLEGERRHPAIVNERDSIANDLAGLRAEVDAYYTAMRGFQDLSLEEVFIQLAGLSARASEIRTNLIRQDRRAFQAFRTGEIDPFLTEVDRQFKVWSRLQSVREMEFKMTGPVT
jgi:hypothetical protein